jgi:uncharacterized membrane protein
MADDSPGVDATDPELREVGEGLLDEGMGPSSAMAHLYRGEVHRMKFWRERLDRTTRWAVVACRPRTWHAKGELRAEGLRHQRERN